MNHKFVSTTLCVCAVAAALLAFSLFSGNSTPWASRQSAGPVTQRALTDLLAAEAAARDYLLMSDEKSIKKYRAARQQTLADANNLKGSGSTPSQPRVASAIARRVAVLDHVTQLKRQGRSTEALSQLDSAGSASVAAAVNAELAATPANSRSAIEGIIAFVIAAFLLIVMTQLDRAQRQSLSQEPEAQALDGEPRALERTAEAQRSEDKFQRIVETAMEGVWVVNTSGETTFVNSRMAEILGYSVPELHGRQHIDFMDAEGVRIAEENSRRRRLGLGDDEDFRFIKKDGTPVWALVATNPLKDAAGNVIGALAMVTDITVRKRVEEEHKLYKGAIMSCSNGIAIVDAQRPELPIVYVNPAFEALTGYRYADVVGQPPSMLKGIDRNGRELCPIHLARVHGSHNDLEIQSYRKDDTPYWQEVFVAPIYGEQNVVTHFVAVQNDISARKSVMEALQQAREELEHKVEARTAELQAFAMELQAANEKLAAQALTDDLTGLKNERVFVERLSQEVQRSARYSTALSIMLVDVDGLKDYNASFGNAAGDEVLKAVGKLIEGSARQTDIVARTSADKFGVIMVNTDQANSTVLGDRIRRAVEQAPWNRRAVTVSIGVATLGVGMSDPHRFVDAASEALLNAKRNGRNRVSDPTSNDAKTAISGAQA